MEEKNLLIPSKAPDDSLGAAATGVLTGLDGVSTFILLIVAVSGGFVGVATAASTISLLLHLALHEGHS